MKKEIFLLQGIIFQHGVAYGTDYRPGVGLAMTVKEAMHFAIFHAVIGELNSGELSGHMQDRWGYSEIRNFKLSDEKLSYEKLYPNRPVINYIFTKKEGNLWLGGYSGEDCGNGESKCVVTLADESFFEFKQ